jgi:hypothetical protein
MTGSIMGFFNYFETLSGFPTSPHFSPSVLIVPHFHTLVNTNINDTKNAKTLYFKPLFK